MQMLGEEKQMESAKKSESDYLLLLNASNYTCLKLCVKNALM